ncbi:MAG TPA: glycosyltransferase family 4 protein [Rhodanobacteraceae bacterium]|nr:glycosyltransferase family 4 protein [Rhodanobacteraceae bacterium]
MNVLHVTLSFSRGGRRQAITSLCHGLATRGVTSSLCCLDDYGCEPGEREDVFADSINLHRHRLFDVVALHRLRRYCSTHRIDLLHTHDAASQATCALAMPFGRTPLMMSYHRSLDFEEASLSDRVRNQLAGLRTRAIVTASQARRQHYVTRNRVAPGKVLCVPLGVDLVRFHAAPVRHAQLRAELGVDEDTCIIGAAGHYGREKGLDIVIDAFQRLCRAQPQARLALVVLGQGTPVQERNLRAGISAEFASRIHLVGFQAEPQRWFQGFDLFVHGAREEAFGLVLAEAMACGAAVVAPAIGGIPDVVVDNECGCLVPTPDAQAISDALAALLHDPVRRQRLVHNGMDRARRCFDQDQYASRIHELYLSLAPRQPALSARSRRSVA